MGEVKETLIVKSKVREYVKSLGDFNVSGDFLESLNQKVGKLLKHAAKRTEANSRKTVAARDI
jgi:histone H3/H4